VSGIFDDAGQAANPPRRTPSRRPRALLPTLGIVVLLVVLFSIFVEVWTGRLWYHALGYGNVFSTMLWTRLGLFVVFGLALAAATVGNAILAFRTRPILIGDGYRNPTIERYQDTIDPIRHWVLIGLGLLMFVFGGASGAGQWKTYLLWRNGDAFGQNDVYFGKDIGFFVFGYPWYRYLISFTFTLLIVTLIVTAATHYLYGGIRLQARANRVSQSAQVQISVLVGIFMLLKAVSYWLDRYGLAMSDGHLFTGISYTDEHAVLPSKTILAIIALICALLFFGNVVRPGWMLPVLGLGLLILSSILIGGIWPAIVQRFQVKPSEPDKESSYIEKNITATRNAFDLNDITYTDYRGTTTDTPRQLQAQAAALPGVRLIDPRLVSPAFEQLQQQRGFYQMPPVLDVDRYSFEGSTQPQDVVIAARELNLDNVPDRNWANDHTVYTHGYGVVAAYGDRRSSNGEPVWAQQGLPSRGQLGDFEQRIYYGETEPDYSIVGAPEGTAPVELNIPETSGDTDADQNTTYDGDGGVPIGSTFNQLLYAAKFWDSSILLSGRVNAESSIIYDREPREMVEKAAPWLTVDGDSYPAVVDGRLLWILDGYTTTADYPMSEHVDLSDATSDSLTSSEAVAGQPSDDINYIRNSVKATVDAYDGTVTLYAWDEEDPILKAWMSAFPGTVESKDQVSPDLLDHLRYPEDLFKVQRETLTQYHVSDPLTFYQGSEKWTVPEDPEQVGNAQPPYYLSVKLPQKESEFSLTSVYVPTNRSNLASFMSVNANAASDEYGQYTVLELPSDNAVSGPGQASNAIQNDTNVTEALLPYRQSSQVTFGNLLTLPVGDELLYVEPVYTLRTGEGTYPILQFVLVSLGSGESDDGSGDQVGIGESFSEALAVALGLTDTAPPDGGGETEPGGGGGQNETLQQQIGRLLDEADQAFTDAQAAYTAGDLGRYQELNQQASDLVAQALDLYDQLQGRTPESGAPTTGGATSGGATSGTTPTETPTTPSTS
jgi:uncharacterized membrane protein (UPF0182 family)